MTLRDLGKLLPKAQPTGLIVHKGETVYLRMKRCSHLLFEARVSVLNQDVAQAAVDTAALIRLTLSTTGVEYELTAGDNLFTATWINSYAGRDLVEVKPIGVQSRLGRLAHLISKSETEN